MDEEKKPGSEPNEPPKAVTLGDHLHKEISLAEKRKMLTGQYEREIAADEKAQEYFKAFLPASVEYFVKHYAAQKATWMTETIDFKEWNESDATEWEDNAFERLQEIQQKKLFDIQCQWRAEKLTLHEIIICMDFKYWENNVMNCPFIAPVTEEEINIYMQYLESFNFEDEQGWFESWQDYHGIKEAYETDNANRNFPEWYDFYNGRKGTGVYLQFPDLRGMKEDKYIALWREEKNRLDEANKIIQPPAETRPHLTNWPHSQVPWFVETFEDKKTQAYFKVYGGNKFDDDDDDFEDTFGEDIDNITHYLEKAREIIPVQAWFDYREALSRAYRKYECRKIAEAMPAAYQRYMMYVTTGMQFNGEPWDNWKKNHDDWINIILRGRELCGEPRDLDF